jgi:PEGA domain
MNQCSFRNRNLIIGIIACLLLTGFPSVLAADETSAQPPIGGTITVISFPPGAAVYLNGEFRGVTTAILQNVSPGNYIINVSLAGYRNETFKTTIYNGSTREFGVNLENASAASASLPAGSGSIAIDSNPGDASVILDGNPVGRTPSSRSALILNSVPAGVHTVTVDLAGYPPYTSTVTVVKNQVVQVNADFLTGSPTLPGTPVATTNRGEPVPLSPLMAVAAAGLAGLAAAFRRS